jgi:hypothetical protein
MFIPALFLVACAAALGAQSAGAPPTAVPPPRAKFTPPDTTSTLRGSVTDSQGHALDSIEVYVMTSGRSTRTDTAGHYVLPNPLNGPTLVRARRVGWKATDTSLVLIAHRAATVKFTLSSRVSALDTIRIRTSQDDCAPRSITGFACRRGAGIGVFRDSAELAALNPEYDADLFDGIPGLRRDGHNVRAVTQWRCLARLINGHPPTPYDRANARMLGYVKDVKAIEFYADANDAPKWYKIYAWPRGSATPCSLIVYWTR